MTPPVFDKLDAVPGLYLLQPNPNAGRPRFRVRVTWRYRLRCWLWRIPGLRRWMEDPRGLWWGGQAQYHLGELKEEFL